jgi:hypothetical protein
MPAIVFCSRAWPAPTIQTKSTSRGVAPHASYLSCLAKKGNPKKAPPVCRRCAVPCVARLPRRLRNSHDPLRVHVLKQSSPESPDQPVLLGGAQGKWEVRFT